MYFGKDGRGLSVYQIRIVFDSRDANNFRSKLNINFTFNIVKWFCWFFLSFNRKFVIEKLIAFERHLFLVWNSPLSRCVIATVRTVGGKLTVEPIFTPRRKFSAFSYGQTYAHASGENKKGNVKVCHGYK